jgi:NAD(P)-dependent dehydrogenase (short-subunit alcohol dehydrogenase family)
MFRLDGQTAIVTGASSGLGARFATTLAEAGATVIAAARRADRLEALAATHANIRAFPCDVSDPDALAALVDHAGTVDVLVNNAGVSAAHPAEHEPLDSFRAVIDINLTSVFALSQLAGRRMLERQRGSIINIASIFGLVASAPIGQASYNASKAAVVNLTRELAGQWARKGVRVNAIAPGFFASEMTAELYADERSMQWIRRNTPMGRPGEPHELDGALLFLSSAASSYVTGTTLAVDGGWTSR